MEVIVNYRKPFVQFVKKQHKCFKLVIGYEVERICDDIYIGELKVGDLSGVRVHKFRFEKNEYLIAYYVDVSTNLISTEIEFINLDFYKIGVHEKFYEELKKYLK